jgi:cysteine synthase A
MIYRSGEELVGRTPILELSELGEELGLAAKIYLKLECFSLTGSIKDRAALNMLDDAEARGVLGRGATIIEPTSGNTGIGLAAIGVPRGYRVIIVMPDSMSEERIKLMRAYGAEVVLTPGALGMQGAIDAAREMAEKIDGAFIPSQFENSANADAHYRTTAPEIYDDLDSRVDMIVAGIGTGGTVTGIGRYFREHSPTTRIIGVEPADSPVLTEGRRGAHKIQGIGAGFVPTVLDSSVVDEVATATTDEAYAAVRLLARRMGILVGVSSGAALSVAIRLAGMKENEGRSIVAILPDSGSRYLSTPELF